MTSTFNKANWTLSTQKPQCCCLIPPPIGHGNEDQKVEFHPAPACTWQTAHTETYLWMHCVWLGLINTYNVVGNQASQACVIIGSILACNTGQRVCFRGEVWCVSGTEDGPTALHCALSCWNIWTDRFFVTNVRARLTWFDSEDQANTKALSYSLGVNLSVCQGCMCAWECLSESLSVSDQHKCRPVSKINSFCKPVVSSKT